MTVQQPTFKFNLAQPVAISISGEQGVIRSRCDGIECANQYLVAYKNALGAATENWWKEDLLAACS